MKNGSTLFLKGVIYLLGAFIFGVCIIIVGNVVGNPDAKMYAPALLGMVVAAIPFFYALYQGLLLLSYIEKNTAFSEDSVKAVQRIEYCAFAISTIYALGMPFLINAADKDDAPGAVIIWLVFIFASLVTGVFATVLRKLLRSGLDIKSENDLTV